MKVLNNLMESFLLMLVWPLLRAAKKTLGIWLILGLVVSAQAANKKQKKVNSGARAQVTKKIQPSLGTSHRFDGMSLHGKFQSTPWSSATVEDDKFLEDLLAARSHFRDRMQQDQERN